MIQRGEVVQVVVSWIDVDHRLGVVGEEIRVVQLQPEDCQSIAGAVA